MKVNITQHRPGQGGTLCLPMVKNIPNGREGWKKTTCPVCGRECWITPGHAEAMSKEPELKAACTECAIWRGSGK